MYYRTKKLKWAVSKIFCVSIVLGLVQCKNSSEEVYPVNQGLTNIRSNMLEEVESGVVASISIGVYHKGEVIWKESMGWSDKENKIESNVNTVYALGSLSKSITGTLMHILAAQQYLSLDDSVELASSLGLKRKPTVSQLLQMEGGISHQYKYYSGSFDQKDAEKDFREFGFVGFEPGSVYHYSNLSYGLLDWFVSQELGIPTYQVLEKELLKPLGMTRTYGDKGTIPESIQLAKGYFDDGSTVDENRFEPRGGAGFYSNISDLLKYGKFHIYNLDKDGNVAMDNSRFNEIHTISSSRNNSFYASGWANLALDTNTNLLLSNGAIAGAATSLVILPQEELVIVCLSNTSIGNTYVDDLAFQIAGSLVDDFTSKLENTFADLEPQFEPIDFKSEMAEVGRWAGNAYIEGDTIPLTLEIDEQSRIQLGLSNGSLVTLPNASREQGLVIASLEGVRSIGGKSLDSYFAELRLQFYKNESNGVLFLNSKEDLPSGLPYWISLKRVTK